MMAWTHSSPVFTRAYAPAFVSGQLGEGIIAPVLVTPVRNKVPPSISVSSSRIPTPFKHPLGRSKDPYATPKKSKKVPTKESTKRLVQTTAMASLPTIPDGIIMTPVTMSPLATSPLQTMKREVPQAIVGPAVLVNPSLLTPTAPAMINNGQLTMFIGSPYNSR